MNKQILVLDDEKIQAENLQKALERELVNINVFCEFTEDKMLSSIQEKFFNLAIVDLRMDNFSINGIDLIKEILTKNPFSSIIVVSAHLTEFASEVSNLLSSGKIIHVTEKKTFIDWIPELKTHIENYYEQLKKKDNSINNSLLEYYSELKNEEDSYKKGEKFENFLALLFGNIGYNKISKRLKDKSSNEVDLIIRNEINDSFLSRLGEYFFVECKNYPNKGVGKNEFILFYSKIKASNGLSKFGILATTGYIARTTYYEALRESKDNVKIIFISNPEIEQLINSDNLIEEFKNIIDTQVKDN